MEKVIPQGLNYSDVKPEAIESQIKVIKFTSQQASNLLQPNDVVRFMLQGNGFFDPYSAYIRLRVRVDDLIVPPTLNNPVSLKILDRSAHSFINRLVIRSQGTEIERIEQYDVMAAMINDVIYSHEQMILHHYEGFPNKKYQMDRLAIDGYNDGNNNYSMRTYVDRKIQNPDCRAVGEIAYGSAFMTGVGLIPILGNIRPYPANQLSIDPLNGRMVNDAAPYEQFDLQNGNQVPRQAVEIIGNEFTFCIPIYSGIIGVLMPDKKLLPLSLMPLEVEFTLNPHALFACGTATTRSYTVVEFNIFSHMMFFEQEMHRSLESVVAEHGIFIHFNTFRLAPVAINNAPAANTQIAAYSQINNHSKSINSIHWVFMYTDFERNAAARKLQFVSHQLSRVQVRNGVDLLPSEPIEGNMADGNHYRHVPFLIEMYKSWNKMHDTATDGAIDMHSYCIDDAYPIHGPGGTLRSLVEYNARLGRCQYGVSFEGEEIGTDKTIIAGRKGLIPFDLNVTGYKSGTSPSALLLFVRADYILYVRPDLVVTILGQ